VARQKLGQARNNYQAGKGRRRRDAQAPREARTGAPRLQLCLIDLSDRLPGALVEA